MSTALRTALIWHDEVMSDLVSEKPAPITLGPSPAATFVTPEIGLPRDFAVVSPGARGYRLTLGHQMAGTICIGGVEQRVADFVKAGDDPTGFRATAIGGADWGVIDLDADGACKLFFQFVPLEEPQWTLSKPVLLGGAVGYALAIATLTAVWSIAGLDLGEAAVRGAGIATLALGAAAVVRWMLAQDAESHASLGFSVLLHAALLFATFRLYSPQSAFAFPPPRPLTAEYVLTRIEATIPTTATDAGTGHAPTIERTAVLEPFTKAHEPTFGPPRVPRPVVTPSEVPNGPPGPRGGVLKFSNILDDLRGHDVGATGDRVRAITQNHGNGDRDATGRDKTRGGGEGEGPAGEHTPQKDPIDIGPVRPAVACFGSGCDGGGPVEVKPPPNDNDEPTLNPSDIDRVVRARASLFRACYQKQLNRIDGLGGKLVIQFVIAPDGHVPSTRLVGDTLRNGEVSSCVRGFVQKLKFPARGGATVTYPFIFSAG